jgi:metal-responsive CopG/Arc/MetJ family transcriptional regulator
MKTAISLPDTLYEDAEKTAKSMGIPRSQLFAKALEEFINHHKKESITEKYNEIYSQISSEDVSKIESVSIMNLRELTKNDTW